MILLHCDSRSAITDLKYLVDLLHADRLKGTHKRKHGDLSSIDIQWCIWTW